MLKEQFWKTERPCFAKEENKVLNVIHALLISSAEKMEEERDFATKHYSQKLSGINEPTLKAMCHGPDFDFKQFKVEDEECDMTKDEAIVKKTLMNVEHERCSNFKREDSWKYVHGENDQNCSNCDQNNGMLLEGL